MQSDFPLPHILPQHCELFQQENLAYMHRRLGADRLLVLLEHAFA